MAGKSAPPKVQITGAVELRRALARMGADVNDLKEINQKAAERVAEDARDRAPRRSGALAKSIRARSTKKAGRVFAGKKKVPYAGVIHFGWPRHNIRPQPFIFQALDARKDEVIADYERRIGDLVERVGRETP